MKLQDEHGFTTVGMVVALLVTLSLIFTTAQVYRINSASAEIQDVADACALAAENETAEFMVLVRVCDAVILSMDLAGLTSLGLGVAALCTPVTAGVSDALLSAGKSLIKARNSFAEKSSEGLDKLQRALPFLAAVNAASVAKANDGGQHNPNYYAFAVLAPWKGEPMKIEPNEEAKKLCDDIDEQASEIKENAEEADRLAEEADQAKDRAFDRDCGDAPEYCMYERAAHLAGLSGKDNPTFSSSVTWSFSVALKRAQAYYAARVRSEAPLDSSVAEQAKSVLRQRFFQYAVQEMQTGYVHESDWSFDAHFPLLPCNTPQMRETELFSEVAYPITQGKANPIMHAWPGCPNAAGASSWGSISQLEAGRFETCELCQFQVSSMGHIASASSSIDNGFEYHYRKVAEEAETYEKSMKELEKVADDVRKDTGSLLDRIKDLAKDCAGKRLSAKPPGSYGSVAFVVNLSEMPASTGFESSFVKGGQTLGARAAIAGATIIEEQSSASDNVITSVLDGFEDKIGAPVGVPGLVLQGWTKLLGSYAKGQESVTKAIRVVADSIPFASASGLGTWAADKFCDLMDGLGLEPANVNALKPVLVNTGHVASHAGGEFSSRFLVAKARVASVPAQTADVFTSVISETEKAAIEELHERGTDIELAIIAPLGDKGPSWPITVSLPPAVMEMGEGAIHQAAAAVQSVCVQITGVKPWQ